MESKIFTHELDIRLIDLVRENGALYDWRNRNYKDFTVKMDIWNDIAADLGKDAKECQIRWKTIRDTYRRNQNKINSKLKSGSRAIVKSKYTSKLNLSFLDRSMKKFKKSELHRTRTDSMEEPTNYQFETSFHPEENEHFASEEAPTSVDMLAVSETSQDVYLYDHEQPQIEATDGEDSFVEQQVQVKSEEPEQNVPKRKKTSTEKVVEEMRLIREERTELMQGLLSSKEDRRERKSKEHPLDLFFLSMSETVKTLPPHLAAEARLKVCQIVTEIELKSFQQNPH